MIIQLVAVCLMCYLLLHGIIISGFVFIGTSVIVAIICWRHHHFSTPKPDQQMLISSLSPNPLLYSQTQLPAVCCVNLQYAGTQPEYISEPPPNYTAN